MVEVPSAALLADRLAGARGLLLDRHERPHAVHDGRGSRERARRARSPTPSIPRSSARSGMTVEAADARGRWVGVCGELAGDPDATALLLGLGVRELSMGAPSIALVKRAVRAVDLAAARARGRRRALVRDVGRGSRAVASVRSR